jgi:hypothetical protein
MKTIAVLLSIIISLQGKGQSKSDSSFNLYTSSSMYYMSFYTDMMPQVMLGVKYDNKNRIVDTVIRLTNCDSITAIKLMWKQYQKTIDERDRQKKELIKEYEHLATEYNKLYDAYSYQRKLSNQLIKDVDAQLQNIKKQIK